MYRSMYVLSVTVRIDQIISASPRRESACGAHSIPKPGSRLCPHCKTNNLECSLRSTQGEGNEALEGRVHYPKWVKRLPSQEHSMSLPVLSPTKLMRQMKAQVRHLNEQGLLSIHLLRRPTMPRTSLLLLYSIW